MTLLDAFGATVSRHRDDLALRIFGDRGDLTWADCDNRARRLAAGFRDLGVGRGDTVALLLFNRSEFYLADLAALMLGAVPVSVYPTSAPEQIDYLLADADAKVLVTERALVETAKNFAGPTVVIEDAAFQRMSETTPLQDVHPGSPDEIATIIYTSGTTGPPKGVELTHRSVLAAVAAMAERTGLGDRGHTICWLPMAHIAARCATYYGAIVFGDEVTICADPRRINEVVAAVHPTWFFGVPRVWEKLQASVQNFIASLDGSERDSVNEALVVAFARARHMLNDETVPEKPAHTVADADAVLAPVRRAVGLDRVRCAQVGAAPIAADVVAFFHALGVPLAEIYGFSEGIVCSAPDPRRRITIGSAGPALQGVEIKIADDGEILVRGRLLMSGYRNQPEATAACYTRDGFFRSGDIGQLVDGELRIVDRKKDLIINAAGKNMSPANIESAIKSGCPLIAQVVAIGDGRPYNIALICLDPEEIGERSRATLNDEVQSAIARGNARLSRVEQIKRFAIMDSPWVPGGDELTPTMKLRRRRIAEKHAATIEALYAATGAVGDRRNFDEEEKWRQ
ncbi:MULTISPECIES: AMP-dependent synthetase/ligase [Mycobacterium]|nr:MULTISPECIES: AMP-dependent synthetase/ligase [Mycobacterium]